jgi:hypothetical protein
MVRLSGAALRAEFDLWQPICFYRASVPMAWLLIIDAGAPPISVAGAASREELVVASIRR